MLGLLETVTGMVDAFLGFEDWKDSGAGNFDLAATLYDSRRSSDRRFRDCAGADLPQSFGKNGWRRLRNL